MAAITRRVSTATRLAVRGFASSSTPSSIAAAVAAAAPAKLALLAPQQEVSWTYEELDLKARCLASGLEDLGYKPGTVAICDVPNVAENFLLQCALAHVGATIMTPPKDADALAKMCSTYDVRGVICVDGAAPPLSSPLSSPLPAIHLDVAEGLRPAAGSVAFGELIAHCPPRGGAPAATEDTVLGVFGGAALTQSAALALGSSAASKLALVADDRVCCSVTLMHAMGMGTSVSSALIAGAAVVLPAVGGIRGCGDPKQRASVTADVLASTGATVLFGDTHTLRAMRAQAAPATPLALRTGVVKIGSGSTFLDGVTEAPGGKGADPLPLEFAGVAFHAMGKAA